MTSQPSPSAPKRRKPMGECKKCIHKRHARACKACGCAYKSKARKPVKARNVARRDPVAASRQRELVLERDGFCVFDEKGVRGWERCRVFGHDNLVTAHVFRRRHCGSAVYDPDVAVAGCDRHHKQFDSRLFRGSVRLPEYAITRARNAINAVVLVENRIPETSMP